MAESIGEVQRRANSPGDLPRVTLGDADFRKSPYEDDL